MTQFSVDQGNVTVYDNLDKDLRSVKLRVGHTDRKLLKSTSSLSAKFLDLKSTHIKNITTKFRDDLVKYVFQIDNY